MIRASVYIIAQNEERHISRCLKSVEGFDEVIVVDSGSTDDTIKIAQSHGARVIHQPFLGYSEQKEFAKNQCQNEWVLNLDADEELSTGLKNEIGEFLASAADSSAAAGPGPQNASSDSAKMEIAGFEVPIFSYYLGALPHPYTHPICRVRFFKKSAGIYPPKLVHESIKIDGRVRKSRHFIYDYGLVSIQKQVDKINNYSSLRASEKALRGKKASLLKLIFAGPGAFFKAYFLRRQFLNGKRGLIMAAVLSFYAFLKEAKLYEKEAK